MFTAESLARIIHIALTPITTTRHPLWSNEAEELLTMIAAHESKMGKYNKQVNGPARGVCQVEPNTLFDNYVNFINPRPDLGKQIAGITGCDSPDLDQLRYNPIYNVIHARLWLYRRPGRIPTDTWEMAKYAKEQYNTSTGAATAEDYLRAYYSVRKFK